MTCREAIRLAIDRLQQQKVDTCWMDAGTLLEPEWAHCGDAEWAGGTLMECGYRATLKATAVDVWESVRCVGGKTGWYCGDYLWRLRGILDRLLGGVGLRRGRRHPTDIGVGDALDFWRVLEVDQPDRLLLAAEMKTPGEALLEFRITPMGKGQVQFELHSRFMPQGLFGLLYWYVLYPFHQYIFFGMLKAMAKSINKPILAGPERFTPKLHTSCALPPKHNH
jgi:hypothetical protein